MKKTHVTLATLLIAGGFASAASIAVDFNNTTVVAWSVTGAAGPLGTAIWNSTPTNTGGPSAALVDDTGTATTATVAWNSANTWTNGDGNSTDDHKLAHAYLDDGDGGILVTISNIPYAEYRVYGLVATDQGDTYDVMNFDVNGAWAYGGDATTRGLGYGKVSAAIAAEGTAWIESTDTVRGNYWTIESTGATLVVDGQQRDGNARGTLTGVIIEEVPEPTTTLLGGLAGLFFMLRRRR